MASTNPGAQTEVTNYINSLEGFPKEICKSLRRIILNSSAELQEQWKWGPHYFCEGMVCGFGGFQNHAKLTFFNGSAMKDENKLFNHCVDNLFSRSIKFETIKELDEKMVIKYVRESIGVNKKGFKRIIANKTVIVPGDLESLLSKNK